MEKQKKIGRIELYLITQLALEYRVPIDELARTFRYDKNYLYDSLIFFNNKNVQEALRYVMDNETVYISENAKKEAKRNLRRFLTTLTKAKTKTEKISLINSLNHDKEVLSLRYKDMSDLTKEEKESIVKYRLKYALSRLEIERHFKISSRAIKWAESNMEDDIFKERLLLLNNRNDLAKKPLLRKK